MKTFKNQAAQGDILITRIKALPINVISQKPNEGNFIVAHSETGHHHTVTSDGVQYFQAANDPMIAYLVIDNSAELIHNRSFDTHESIGFDAGIYEIRRQREYTPEGWRRVAD